MKTAYLIFLCFFLLLIGRSYAQPLSLTQQDSAAILEQAGLKVMFWEATLNYLADPVGRSKSTIELNSYTPKISGRVFWDEEVQIEEDLDPHYRMAASPPHFISVSGYLKKFRDLYATDDPNSVQFKVSKIRGLSVNEQGISVEIFFESILSGAYRPDSTSAYSPTYRLASLKVLSIDDQWHCYISSIQFASPAHMQYYIPAEYKTHQKMMDDLQKQEP